MKKQKLNIIFLILFIPFSAFSQYSPEYNKYKKKYSDSHAVILNAEEIINIQLVKDEISIICEKTKEYLYLGQTAKFNAKESVNYNSFFEILDIKASTFIFKKNKYHEEKVKEFKKKDELSGSFRDDRKSINFIYPYLEEGAKTKLFTKEKIKNPRFLPAHYFGDFSPIIHDKLTIIIDKNISLKYTSFNLEDVPITFNKTENKGKIIYTWETKDIDKYESEDNAPNYRTILPHVVPYISEYKTKNGTTKKLLNDVSGLYNWYTSLIKKIDNKEEDKQLKIIVDSLTKDKKNEIEKVKSIFYWTQQNIKYVAFEYALGGFVPREAADVYNKKYGDCKDNSNILYEMLKIAGIKGYLTWIGTRKIPYKYKDVPTPASDNHMILTYIDANDTLFLDATGRFHSLRTPSSFIQGKEALIGIDSSHFKIKTVPVINASKNNFSDSTYININKKAISGSGRFSVDGYDKINFFNSLESITTDKKLKEFYNVNLRKGSNKFLVDKFTESNKYNYEEPFIVDYAFNIDNYLSESQQETYINLNLNKDFLEYKIENDRKNNFKVKYKSSSSYTNTLKIPENFIVTYVPEDFESKNNLYSASIKYEKKDNLIIYKHDISINFLILKKENFNDFNDFIKKISKSYKETIVLQKKSE